MVARYGSPGDAGSSMNGQPPHPGPTQGEDKPPPNRRPVKRARATARVRPYCTRTRLASRFVGIVGAHPCGRPAAVALLSRPFAFPISFTNKVM